MVVQARNYILDAVKALAILLVVYGHCIQYISGTEFWENRIFQIIYSFHMPLFFMLSGFFFVGQQEKSAKDFIIKKTLTLLVPCLMWATLSAVGSLVMTGDIKAFILKIITPSCWPFWFLKGLFIVQIVAWVSLFIIRKITTRHFVRWAAVLSLAVFLIPGTEVARVMLPLFWGGWLLRKHYDSFQEKAGLIALISGIVFLALLLFWDSNGMRFYAGTTLSLYGFFGDTQQPLTDWLMLIYRLVIGAAGSIAVISVIHLFPSSTINRPIINRVGTSTEAIYILQACFLEHLIGGFIAQKTCWLLPLQHMHPYLLFGIVLPMTACLLVLFCTFIYQQTGHFPHQAWLVRLFFGGAPISKKG